MNTTGSRALTDHCHQVSVRGRGSADGHCHYGQGRRVKAGTCDCIEEAIRTMQERKVRRPPVIAGYDLGITSLAASGQEPEGKKRNAEPQSQAG